MITDISESFNDEFKLEQTAFQVIFVLKQLFESFPKNVRTKEDAPFHEAFLEAFKEDSKRDFRTPYLISTIEMSNDPTTTLDQVFFENIAHILSGGYKRSFSSDKHTGLVLTQVQQSAIAEIIYKLLALKSCLMNW